MTSKDIINEILGNVHETFEPKMADIELSRLIFKDTREIVKFYGRQLMYDAGWRFFGVKQSRGRCYYRSKVITIPAWALTTKPIDYKEWYVSHEMAHAFSFIDGHNDNHGPFFMEMLKAICPSDCVHYELAYKPSNASAAGIRLPEHLRVKNILDDIL